MTLIYLTLAWLCGILLSHLLWSQRLIGCTTPGWPFGAAAGAAFLALLMLRRHPRARLASLLLLALILGSWRYQSHPFAPCPTASDLAFYNGNEQHSVWATVEGVVVGYPDVRDVRTFYRLRAETVTISDETRPVRGDILVQAKRFPPYAYGDRLRVTGNMQTPPTFDDFDYRAYLARQGVHSLMRRARVELVDRGQGTWFWATLYGLRARGSALLGRILPEPAAALANGMLLGIESGIPPAVDEAFKLTGTTHVIVISGSNIALLSGVLLAMLGRMLGKRRAALPTIIGITLYVLLVGADAASLRAGLMGALYVIAIALGRQSTAVVSLFASALFMTLLNPLALWDVGFQLSFMATLGLILFTPAIQARFERFLAQRLEAERVRAVMNWLNDALIVTLAAQIMTLPLIVYYFGRLSLVSLLTNFLILPAQPPIMTAGMATLLAGLIWEPLGRIVAIVPWLFLTYTTWVVELTAKVPWASVETGALGQTLALIYYAVLFGMLGLRRLTSRGWVVLPGRRAVVWAAAVVLPLWLGVSVLGALPDGHLYVFFLHGDGGEAALVVTPSGRRVWVWDGQGEGGTLAVAARPLLKGWGRDVAVALCPGGTNCWPGAQVVDPWRLEPGAAVRLDAAVTLTRLDAGEQWALKLTCGEFSTLLPATLKPEGQDALLTAGDDLHVTLLKAPGPDTGTWPTPAFLAATAPQAIFWPQETTYPPNVAALLTERGALRVPADAVVEVITDGARMWFRQRRGSR